MKFLASVSLGLRSLFPDSRLRWNDVPGIYSHSLSYSSEGGNPVVLSGLYMIIFLFISFILIFPCVGHAGPNTSAGCSLDLDYSTRNYDAAITTKDIDDKIEAQESDEFFIAVVAQNSTNLDTYQIEVNFDPIKLSFLGGFEDHSFSGVDNFLKKNGGGTVGFMAVERDSGIVNIANALSGTDEAKAPEGSGVIAILKFKVLDVSEGIKLTLFNVNFLDSNGVNDSVTNLNGGEITSTLADAETTVAIASSSHEVSDTSSVKVTITFSNSVEGFESSDIELVNAVVSEFDGSDEKYEVMIKPDGNEDITIKIPASVALGSNGDPNIESELYIITNNIEDNTSLNKPPLANAGEDQTVKGSVKVTLSASNSADPDGTIQSYIWEQTEGTLVTLSDANAIKPTFTTSLPNTESETMVFKLTVTDDNDATDSDFVNIVVKGTEQNSETGDNDVEIPKPDDNDVEIPEPGDNDVEIPEPGDNDVETLEPGDSDVETPEPGDSDVETPEPGDNDVETPEPADDTSENTEDVSEITIKSGVILDNTKGIIRGGNNFGIIVGGKLLGEIVNKGEISGDVILGDATTIEGGKISGTLSGGGAESVIFNAVIDVEKIENVKLGFGCKFTAKTISKNNQLDLTEVLIEKNGIANPDIPFIVDQNENELSLSDILLLSVTTSLDDETFKIESNDMGMITISSQKLGDAVVPAKVKFVKTTSEPDTLNITSNGNFEFVHDGIATTLVPDSIDKNGFDNGLKGVGIDSYQNNDGVVVIDISEYDKMVFRFNNYATMSNDFDGLEIESEFFSTTGDADNLETFAYTINYSTGLTQNLPSFVHDSDQFKQFMDANKINYQLQPTSGVIELFDSQNKIFWRGKPDYMLVDSGEPAAGITFNYAGDLNGDGTTDIYMITKAGTQIIYTLP